MVKSAKDVPMLGTSRPKALLPRPRPRTPAGEGQTCHPALHGRGINHL